jgi:phosphoribosylaminoimidazolecarboxamide formyltransferase/IMP cyclohydrolase
MVAITPTAGIINKWTILSKLFRFNNLKGMVETMSTYDRKRALISVTNKDGIVEFAKGLWDLGYEVVSTGGTAKVLMEAGIEVLPIEDFTGSPEIMDGRVKTLMPQVHGGILARRDDPNHMTAAHAHGIGLISVVVVNLYDFAKAIATPGASDEEIIENIDIGGPAMLRSAAKNRKWVTVVGDPDDYERILDEMRHNHGETTFETRQDLARKIFKMTSHYDRMIYRWMNCQDDGMPEDYDDEYEAYDDYYDEYEYSLALLSFEPRELRYGENPHQSATLHIFEDARPDSLANAQRLQGKELSYNNYLDLDAALKAVNEFGDQACCVIVKHQTPCGIAVAKSVTSAYRKAWEVDPVSAYGGVMAFNKTVNLSVVQAVFENKQFVEAIVAPDYTARALEALEDKPNIRVISTLSDNQAPHLSDLQLEYRSIDGGILEMTPDRVDEDPDGFSEPTKRKTTEAEWEQLLFAWKCAKSVKSNAIVIAKDFAMIGAGAGQPNRVNSAKLAVSQAGDKAKGAVAASDAFLPYPDTLQALAQAGVTALIQPGGSIRDPEVIAFANAAGIAMVFTGVRHFRH